MIWLGSLACMAAGCGRVEEPQSHAPRTTRAPVAAPRPSLEPAASPPPSAPPPGSSASGAPAGSTGSIADRRCIFPTAEVTPPAASALPRGECPPDPKIRPTLPHGRVTFVDAPGAPSVDVERAIEPEHRERGLMFRTSMPDSAGMIFSWDEEQVHTFWMHNTCIALDMLFIAKDGTIVGLLEQVPVLNDDARKVPCASAHVLELNAGWSRKHGVRAGQKVRLPG